MSGNNELTYLESLRSILDEVMDRDDRVIIIGEDITDPYGGAFKVTRGLSSKYPERVLNTPVSEAAIVGIGIGLAIRGFLPVVEIMFGDFITLCTDQIVNSGTKFPLMYRGKVEVPIVIRTPMGGGRGYGPTHSQSLEKMFLGVPGLKIIAPSVAHVAGDLLKNAILEERSPVLFIEHKLLYATAYDSDEKEVYRRYTDSSDNYPIAVLDNFSPEADPDVVILSYGGSSLLITQVMADLVDQEINVRAVFPSLLNNRLGDSVFEFVKGCEAVIIAEEGTAGFNWGSEIAASLYDMLVGKLTRPIIRLSSNSDIIPARASHEHAMLFNKEKLSKAIFESLL